MADIAGKENCCQPGIHIAFIVIIIQQTKYSKDYQIFKLFINNY